VCEATGAWWLVSVHGSASLPPSGGGGAPPPPPRRRARRGRRGAARETGPACAHARKRAHTPPRTAVPSVSAQSRAEQHAPHSRDRPGATPQRAPSHPKAADPLQWMGAEQTLQHISFGTPVKEPSADLVFSSVASSHCLSFAGAEPSACERDCRPEAARGGGRERGKRHALTL